MAVFGSVLFPNLFLSLVVSLAHACSVGQDAMPRRRHEKNVTHQAEKSRSNGFTNRKPNSLHANTLATLAEKYLEHLAVKGFADTTLRVRRVYMEMFLTWCRK